MPPFTYSLTDNLFVRRICGTETYVRPEDSKLVASIVSAMLIFTSVATLLTRSLARNFAKLTGRLENPPSDLVPAAVAMGDAA
jgi:hypothetical protein